ncbi:hypothetical protein LWI29_031727 [Acer saccharum]|uniref:Retrotransposon gag domain-containing protein n=1 Tax=Acer saccharum TaxID=4024 RepID=A0AA39W774_ACESA|nr:hypothetical protein LWI29_031727 [Acer saccharum]
MTTPTPTNNTTGYENPPEEVGSNSIDDRFSRIESSLLEMMNQLRTLTATRHETRNQHPHTPPHQHIRPIPFHIGETPTRQSSNMPYATPSNLKLRMPTFGGDNPDSFLYKAEQFDKSTFEDPAETLSHLKQIGYILSYQDEFERLSQLVDDLPEHYLISSFIAGLKDEIRYEVKIRKPRTLSLAFEIARLIEDKIKASKPLPHLRTTNPLYAQTTVPTTSTSPPSLLGPPPQVRPATHKTNTTITPTRLTPAQARTRRENGLCYYCDEKYVPGHRCATPKLFMIDGLLEHEEDAPQFFELEQIIPEVSFQAITGICHPQTIRVPGLIQSTKVTVLIDGGSTHNFIEKSLVSKLGIPVLKDKTFKVMVAKKKFNAKGVACLLLLTFKEQ